jgi:hypothetical protein
MVRTKVGHVQRNIFIQFCAKATKINATSKRYEIKTWKRKYAEKLENIRKR